MIRTASLLAALLKGDRQTAASMCPTLRTLLAKQPLLYVPLAKGGGPEDIVAVRVRQQALQDLLAWLPRLGLWIETCELLESTVAPIRIFVRSTKLSCDSMSCVQVSISMCCSDRIRSASEAKEPEKPGPAMRILFPA